MVFGELKKRVPSERALEQRTDFTCAAALLTARSKQEPPFVIAGARDQFVWCWTGDRNRAHAIAPAAGNFEKAGGVLICIRLARAWFASMFAEGIPVRAKDF